MTFAQTYQTITQSKAFERFKQEHPDAELVAGFFILDFVDENNQKTLDYKSGDKIFTFSLNENNEITLKEDELIKNTEAPELTKIQPEIKIEIDELKSRVGIRILDEGIKNKIQKIIAVLQIYEEKQIWNLTCMLEGFMIINILIDSNTGEIIKFDKKNMADFIKKK